MSKTSSASKNIIENEPIILVLPGHSSPTVESSSTASLESTTEEVSSKSPSLLGVPSLKESHKSVFSLLPLATSFASSPLSSASITAASKLLTPRLSPPESPVLCESFQQRLSAGVLQQEFIIGQNMLANTGSATPPTTTQPAIAATSSSNSPAPVATSCSSSLPPSSASACHLSSNNNNVHNIKCEPQLTPSPTGGVMTIDNARMMEETANKNNSSSSDTSSVQQRESSAAMQRKNSNSSISANGTGSMVHTSPTSSSHNNDNSNSSNSTISQIMDADAITNTASQQQHPNESSTNGSNKAIKTNSVDDSNDSVNITPSASGSFPNASASKENSSSSTSSSSSSSSSSVSGKDDPEIHAVLGNLASVKKEQHNVETPEMSPDGFGSLPTLTSNTNSANSAVGVSSGTYTHVNNSLINTTSANIILGGINNNNSNGKTSNLIGVGCGMHSSGGGGGGGGPGGCISSLLSEGSSNGQQPISSNFSGNVSIMPNSMDYMQQQNHIFVFSTQLANKGAESVLSGQFPTIIAYHCTQPATKKFLEDFFLKNPMKMAKIQRQNSLNMAISVSTGHQWMAGANSMPTKQQQKTNGRNNIGTGNIPNNQICNNSAIDEKSSASAISASSSAGFPDAPDSLSGEADLMNWEQSSIGLENITNNSNAGHSIKIGEASENIDSSQNSTVANSTLTQQSPHKALGIGGNTAPVSPGDSMQPSLQGVKVPDENLTPQQRQHREEQLAKLKKMNQFLFPEHGGELLPDSATLQGANQLGKLNTDGIIGNPSSGGGLVGILGESSGNSSSLGGGNNQLPNSRGSTNLIGMGRGSASMGRSGVNLGSDESGLPSGIIGAPGDMNNMHCGNQTTGANNLLMNTQQGLSCGPGNIPMGPNSLVGGIGGTHGSNQGGIMSHGNIGGMNSINHCGGASGASGGLMLQAGPSKGMSSAQQIDMAGGGPSQMQWSKMQHQFYEERTKGTKGGPDIMAGITGLCRSISSVGGSYVRSSQPGSGVPASSLSASGLNGRSQGPPPPYHPTQRSASVPIATQSPNPSSPNNPTSNLSLPSPRTASGSCGTTLNSPSSDGLVSASASSTPTTSAPTIAAISGVSNSNNQCKAFQQEDSPTGSNSNNLNVGNNNLRSNINQFNSNPSTPLSNMSPKDMESLGPTGIMNDVKNPRPSPQRSRTPHVAGNNNSEPSNMEGRFPPASPGVNFPSHMQGQGSGPKMSSGGADNQTSTQASFGRRPDNLPLNPNSSRPPPIKQNHHFDPISSLAQMSQQLTSCVSSNGGVSGPSSVGISSSMSSEMPIGGSGHQNMDGLMVPGGPLDAGMDHCGNVPGNSGGMGLSPHMMVGGGQYGGGGCHMGGPLGPMGSRLLAPKGGGSFGSGPGGMRDGMPGFHSGMPTHRMMGRMGVNFCPFNGSPNIQVKASTPNTIQYMPVRPQTNNTNPRVPPSLEFLQRFANPQLSGCPNIGDGPMGPMSSGPGGNADPNKMTNNSANPSMPNAGMNFFQNCNQLGAGSSPGNINGGNQVDMAVGMMTGHSDMGGIMNIGGNPSVGMNIRGMRPVRQGGMGPGGSPVGGGHRMQGPGSHLIGGPGGMNQFGNNPHEVMECVNSDPNGMFGNVQGGPNQMFGPQQKGSPMGGQAHCQNISPANVGINGPLGANEQNSAMQGQINGPGMLGPNANGSIVNGNGPGPGSVSGSGNSGPSSYKPYMGQSSNDLKYAQQYHNFQQQLYATSTRSQVSQQIGGSQAMGLPGSSINSGMPTNSNPGFFVSK